MIYNYHYCFQSLVQRWKYTTRTQFVNLGATVYLKCQSDYSVVWAFKGSYLAVRPYLVDKVAQHVATISSVTFDHEGKYTCYGKNRANQYMRFESITYILIKSKSISVA